MANKPRKGPIPLVPPKDPKQVRIEAQTPKQQTPVWVFSRLDLNGPWCWSKLQPPVLVQILQRLGNLEKMSWADIEQTTGSHFVDIDDLIKDAQDRLKEIQQDDVEQLFSLRVTGKIRVWGIRVDEEFHFLWCDPEHEICPSHKKHT